MSLFLRLLRAWSRYECAQIQYRIQKLTDSLADGLIDLDTYIVRRSDMAIEKQAANDDLHKWDAALTALMINS